MSVRTMKTQLTRVAFVLVALTLIAPVATAQVASIQLSPSQIDWMPSGDYEAVRLTVAGPEGIYFQQDFGAGEVPGFSIFDQAGQVLPDGTYNFELSTAPRVSVADRRAMESVPQNQRGLLGLSAGEGLVEAGTFRIFGGAIVTDTGAVEPGAERPAIAERAAGQQEIAQRDQVIADDLIVQGSECVGMDCSNGYNFGFDTQVYRENNLRVFFDDTSNSGSFPSNDWRLTANDSANGGASYFSIDDATGGTMPFKVAAGAPNNALFVKSAASNAAQIGVGTASPVVTFHGVGGNTPALRLEQNGSSGFQAQTWDLAGNETNFFVRDVTNGSDLPFRIKPGAGDDALFIEAGGNVGLGTDNPDDELHVTVSGANGGVSVVTAEDRFPQLSLIRTGAPSNPDATWRFRANALGDFVVTDGVNGKSPLEIRQNSNNDLLSLNSDTVTVTGQLVVNGTNITPDYVFEPDFALESIEEHADYMFEKKHLPGVGAAVVDENGKHLINIAQRNDGMLEELEKAHIYIAQLNDAVKTKNQKIEELNSLIAQLAERVEAIETAEQ